MPPPSELPEWADLISLSLLCTLRSFSHPFDSSPLYITYLSAFSLSSVLCIFFLASYFVSKFNPLTSVCLSYIFLSSLTSLSILISSPSVSHPKISSPRSISLLFCLCLYLMSFSMFILRLSCLYRVSLYVSLPLYAFIALSLLSHSVFLSLSPHQFLLYLPSNTFFFVFS